MNIKKAIEICTLYMKGSDEAEPVDFDNAILLLIEAGKRIQNRRQQIPAIYTTLLPGETED